MSSPQPAAPACPTCEGTHTSEAFAKSGYAYRRCADCRCLFVAGTLNDGVVHAHYSEAYYESAEADTDGRHGYPSYRGSRETLTRSFTTRVALLRRFVPGGELLDAGAAYGFFLKAAEPQFRGVGLEVSAYAARIAQTEFGANVVHGNIESTVFEDERFDAVVMWDVIEHLIRPLAALREVRRILKPGGVLLVSTDDASHWLPRCLGRRWWALAPPLHLCHFSRRALQASCAVSGLRPPIFFPDPRHYTVPEVITHFGESYESRFLKTAGARLGATRLGQVPIRVSRPEQFVAVIEKPS